MEFIWNPAFENEAGESASLPSGKGLLTHVMYRHYNTPCNIEVQGFFNKAIVQGLYRSQINQHKGYP